MSVYFVTGKLGAGKSLACVGRIRDYLKQGRRVATNLDIFPERLAPSSNKMCITRLPDKPRLDHLEQIGIGSDYYDEENNGLLVLDELGTWFNSRSWQDKERQQVINWCLHARKLRWDILFIVQDISIIDKQLRDTLCEHLVVCRRTDKINVPILGRLFGFITGSRLKFPKVHVGAVHYGDTESAMKVDRWVYLGRDLYNAYDTQQIFSDGYEHINDDYVDCRASYTILSAWHQKGRYLPYNSHAEYLTYQASIGLKYITAALIIINAFFTKKKPRDIARRWGVLKSTNKGLSGVPARFP
jgi:zonular occludens toxin Zot